MVLVTGAHVFHEAPRELFEPDRFFIKPPPRFVPLTLGSWVPSGRMYEF